MFCRERRFHGIPIGYFDPKIDSEGIVDDMNTSNLPSGPATLYFNITRDPEQREDLERLVSNFFAVYLPKLDWNDDQTILKIFFLRAPGEAELLRIAENCRKEGKFDASFCVE